MSQPITAASLTRKISALFKLGAAILALPVAKLHFRSEPSPESIRAVYKYFTKPHPKYKVFGNKVLGAALIDLRNFASGDEFVELLRRSGRGAAERKKAQARGLRVCRIDRNALADEIHQINVSSPVRQGRAMDPGYVEKQGRYEDLPHFRYFGVFDRKEVLVGYCDVGVFGNFACADRILGLRDNDGAMYLLVTEIALTLIEERELDYLMYDTVFGAKAGMRDFKHWLGFRPHRVRYTID
jgi:hypothetical protein